MGAIEKELGHPRKRDLRDLGPLVFGEGWKYRLAAHCEIAVRTVHRWCDPRQPTRLPPIELMKWLRDQSETLTTLGLKNQIASQMAFQVKEGQLHPDVLAAMLTDIAESIKTAKTPRDKVRSPKE